MAYCSFATAYECFAAFSLRSLTGYDVSAYAFLCIQCLDMVFSIHVHVPNSQRCFGDIHDPPWNLHKPAEAIIYHHPCSWSNVLWLLAHPQLKGSWAEPRLNHQLRIDLEGEIHRRSHAECRGDLGSTIDDPHRNSQAAGITAVSSVDAMAILNCWLVLLQQVTRVVRCGGWWCDMWVFHPAMAIHLDHLVSGS